MSKVKLVGYLDLADALAGTIPGDKRFYEVAHSLEDATGKGLVSERLAGLTRLYSSMCYAISGEYQFKNVIQDLRKKDVSLILLNELLSPYLSETLFKLLVQFCDEKYKEAAHVSADLIDYLRKLLKDPILSPLYIRPSSPDEVDRLLDLLILTHEASLWLAGEDIQIPQPRESSKWLFGLAQDFQKHFEDSDVAPWMLFLSLLQASLVKAQIENRSLHTFFHKHDLDCMRFRTLTERYPVLYPSQTENADALLQGEDVLVTSPTGTGKTVLGLLTVASKSESGMSVYAAPTRALAYQVGNRLRQMVFDKNRDAVRVFTREDNVTEDMLANCHVLVGTYEKIDGITRQRLFEKTHIPLVVVDECHSVSNPNRGITLDFFLTKFRETSTAQRLLLSAVIPEQDRNAFAEWAGVNSRPFMWRRTKLDVWIQYQGKKLTPDELRNMSLPFALRKRTGVKEKKQGQPDPVIDTAIDAFRKEKAALVIVDVRATTQKLANKIAETLHRKAYETLLPDRDLQRISEKRAREIADYIRRIDGLELVPPRLVNDVTRLLRQGVVIHHAGLPRPVRSEIEELIEKKLAGVIVATTTLEMGVDFPVDVVLIKRLFETKTINEIRNATTRPYVNAQVMKYIYSRYLDEYFSAYSNIEGRAGRAQFAEQGEVVFFADGLSDLRTFHDMYYKTKELGGGGDIYIVDKLAEEWLPRAVRLSSDESRGRFLSVLLSLIDSQGGSVVEILKKVEQSWLWTKIEKMEFLGPDRISRAIQLVNRELRFLEQVRLTTSDGNIAKLTRLGRHVNVSLVSPTSVARMLGFLEGAKLDKAKIADLELAILYCVSLAYELHIGPTRSSPSEYVGRLKQLTSEKLDARSSFVATILSLWVHGTPTGDIIQSLRLENSAYGFIEHDIPENAVWLLEFFHAILLDKSYNASDKIKDVVYDLIDKVRTGSDNPAATRLIRLDLPKVGRSSALAIVNKFDLKELDEIRSVRQLDFVRAFPGREDIAVQVHSDILAVIGKGA